jgi:hypothetical protein
MTADELYTIELNEWNKTVEFYLSEIDIFQERLAEVAGKNNKITVTAGVELFQNQFIVQKEVLQTIRRDLHRQQAEIVAEVKKGAKITDMDVVDNEFLLRDRVQMMEKILLELKHSFYRFLSKVL